jgi:hypothetical protein
MRISGCPLYSTELVVYGDVLFVGRSLSDGFVKSYNMAAAYATSLAMSLSVADADADVDADARAGRRNASVRARGQLSNGLRRLSDLAVAISEVS